MSEVDFSRLFSDLGVVATYGAEEYGEQLRTLTAGDQILLYDQPSGQYLGAGTVSAPWNGEAVTDPGQKVIPEIETLEYHVPVDWVRTYRPGDGYERASVNRALGYPPSYAPPRTVSNVDGPDDNDLERVYTGLAENETLGPSLSPEKREILEQWRKVATSTPSGVEFDLEGHNRTDVISARAEEFIAEPTAERFKTMWNQMHSAIQGGQAARILGKWDGSMPSVETSSMSQTERSSSPTRANGETRYRVTVRDVTADIAHFGDDPSMDQADVMKAVIDYLIEEHTLMDRIDLPYVVETKALINQRPTYPDGEEPMRHSRELTNGCFVDTHYKRADKQTRLQELAGLCGLDLEFSGAW
jgi:hypothetical protein